MAAAPKVSVASLMEALLPKIRAEITLGIEDAMVAWQEGQQPASQSEIVTAAVEKALKPKAGTIKRRKARKVSDLPAFPEGFVKGATFIWTKSNGSETQHRITSVKDGVAHTRSLQGFQGTWKSTTIIAALQSKNCKLQKPKASRKAA